MIITITIDGKDWTGRLRLAGHTVVAYFEPYTFQNRKYLLAGGIPNIDLLTKDLSRIVEWHNRHQEG
jgi:hypothetical protein